MEIGAVAAGHRGIFDDGDRRIGLAEGHVGQRAGLHQFGDVVGALGGGRAAEAEASRRRGARQAFQETAAGWASRERSWIWSDRFGGRSSSGRRREDASPEQADFVNQ